VGSLGSRHSGATAKQVFTLCWSPTGAASAAPCREDLWGQVAEGAAEGVDACSFLLHVCDDIFTGALQQYGTGSVCCSLLGTCFAGLVVKLCSAAPEEGCSENRFLKQIQRQRCLSSTCKKHFK